MTLWNERSQNILSAFWLRPYSALIRIIEESILNIANKDTGFSLDLGCGDGVFSALLKGHKFPLDFSPYIDIPAHSYGKESIQNSKEKNDYDLFDTSNGIRHYLKNKAKNALWSIGIDHKQSLIDKAQALNSFVNSRTIDFDSSNFIDMYLNCIGSNKVNYAYSNSLYWASKPQAVLDAVISSMDSNAVFQTSLVTPEMIKNMTYSRLHKKMPATAEFLDKGRHRHYQCVKSPNEWIDLFSSVGFKNIEVTPYFTKELAIAVEEMDQREHYPYISRMYYGLPMHDRESIKRDWLIHLEKLLTKHLKDYEYPTIDTCCYFMLTASK